jgi:KDO2-lipid IV(A) lauroyltransferase
VTSLPGNPGVPGGTPGTEAHKGSRESGTGLAAPHHRNAQGRRIRARLAVLGYRAGAWILGRLPLEAAARVGGWIAVAVYWAWPTKRRYVRANAARVLGVAPTDRRVGHLARAVYRNQVRWVLELMRLSRLSQAQRVAQIGDNAAEPFHAAWLESNGLIIVGAHLGNNEAAAAGLAGRGWPINAVADDTAYEELFEHLNRERQDWGVGQIPWRNLREVFRVLRRREIVGLLVDWGYRPDGIPVRFFGAWTRFPAGPAVLAAKTGATILPFWVIRENGRHATEVGDRITVASMDPAELARATQEIAAVLEAGIRLAPGQWCVFKPIWPDDPDEIARLESLAAAQAATNAGAAGAAGAAGGAAESAVTAETGTPGATAEAAPGATAAPAPASATT